MEFFNRATRFAHSLVEGVVSADDIVIDATAGNGHDTEFLCRLVGDNGRVYAFDIQSEALDATRKRLSAAGFIHRATLLHAGHETMDEHLSSLDHIKAVMFNLGYLPGGQKSIVTRPETTVEAIEKAKSLLAPGGIITLVIYPGHQGGEEEATAVESHVSDFPHRYYSVRLWKTMNVEGNPPYVIGIKKNVE